MTAIPAKPSCPVGVLTSQIGYELAYPKRVIVRGPAGFLSTKARLLLGDSEGETCLTVPLVIWGEQWGSYWWVADFSLMREPGVFTVAVYDGERHVLDGDPITLAEGVLDAVTWEHVALGQAERRQRLATKGLGWYDAGCHWQEANSHAAYLYGLCDAWELGADKLTPDQRTRLMAQLRNGTNYLVQLQDLARAKGWADGTLVHQSFRYDDLLLPGNVSKSAVAFARVGRLLGPTNPDLATDYLVRARRSLTWLETECPQPHLSFNWRMHGMPPDYTPPAGATTTDLALRAWAEVELALNGDSSTLGKAVLLARQLIARQISVMDSETGLCGHFRQYESGPVTVKAWSHGMTFDDTRQSSDIGNTVGLNLWPLLRLLEKFPRHADAPMWRDALERFAYGYFLPACRANPFQLMPNGIFPGQGLVWFAGLWHGANAVYGLAAAHALEFARFFWR